MKPELNDTEQILLEVVSETKFTAAEKYRLLDSYFKVISRAAWQYLVERVIVLDRIRMFRGN